MLRVTTACTFSTSQLPKVVRACCALCILTLKCASRHNGVHFFDIATSKSGPNMRCFVHFDLEMNSRCGSTTRMLTRMLMAQMSKHMDMQSHRTLFCNSLFEQSCTYFSCYHSAVWSVECCVWSVKCRVWSVKCGVWSVKCRVRSVGWKV